MKLQSSLAIIFAAVLGVLLGSCATTPTGPAALTGTWTNSLGTVWTINADGTFHVMAKQPKAEIWGQYTVAGDQVTVQEQRHTGTVPKACRTPAVYKFSRPDQNTLALVMVSDTCKPRMRNLTQTWHGK